MKTSPDGGTGPLVCAVRSSDLTEPGTRTPERAERVWSGPQPRRGRVAVWGSGPVPGLRLPDHPDGPDSEVRSPPLSSGFRSEMVNRPIESFTRS